MPEVQAGQVDTARHPVNRKALEDLIDAHVDELNAAVVEHMDKVSEAFYESEESGDVSIEVPSFAPYCGCDTCVQREILTIFVEKLLSFADDAASTVAESAE